jgi:hypothetical protein
LPFPVQHIVSKVSRKINDAQAGVRLLSGAL